MPPRLAFAAGALLLLSGCASTITERISLAETCQQALDEAALAPTWSTTKSILRARLGAGASCAGDPDKLMLECAYEDMERRFAIAERFDKLNQRYLMVQVAVRQLEDTLARESTKLNQAVEQVGILCQNLATRRQCSTAVLGLAFTNM